MRGKSFRKKNKNKREIVLITSFHYTTKLTRGHSKCTFVEEGMGGQVIEKRTKTNRVRGSPIMYVRSLF